MKTIFSILALILALGFEVQARTITEPEITRYKEAVISLLNSKGKTTCEAEKTTVNLDVVIDKSKSLELSEGSQPALTFSYQITSEDSLKHRGVDLLRVLIFTDKSFGEIEHLHVQYLEMGKVNDGTLLEPIMRDAYVQMYKGLHVCY